MSELLYVAGPYRSENVNGIFNNVMRARRMAEAVWSSGYYAITPHLNTAFMDGLMSDDVFLEGTMEMLRRCDGIVITRGFLQDYKCGKKVSEGTKMEYEYAVKNNYSIYVYDEIDDFLYKKV